MRMYDLIIDANECMKGSEANQCESISINPSWSHGVYRISDNFRVQMSRLYELKMNLELNIKI